MSHCCTSILKRKSDYWTVLCRSSILDRMRNSSPCCQSFLHQAKSAKLFVFVHIYCALRLPLESLFSAARLKHLGPDSSLGELEVNDPLASPGPAETDSTVAGSSAFPILASSSCISRFAHSQVVPEAPSLQDAFNFAWHLANTFHHEWILGRLQIL